MRAEWTDARVGLLNNVTVEEEDDVAGWSKADGISTQSRRD